jgi:2-polyprenyl-3-methyl-5-hydroxy-6-metoxy-1,4-benzoquinol methylase
MLRAAMESIASSAPPPAAEGPAWQRVAERFVRFREPGGEAFYEALARHFAHLVDHPVLPLHFEYAATSNARGRAAVQRLEGRARLARRVPFARRPRVLDVGCAYGGFLVAFAERGAHVTGIERDERYVRLAALNLRERGLDGEIVFGDASLPNALSGSFELVIANDVLEHVAEPAAFLVNLRRWLAPGGLAYLEVPNGVWPPYVVQDGHHQLFGVTLLSFAEASEYVRLLSPGNRYDTYNYLGVDAYAQLFGAAGLSFELAPEQPAPTVEDVLSQIARLRAGTAAGLAATPAPMRPLVADRVAAYLSRVESAPRATEEERNIFLRDYGPAFWIFLARRA